VSALSPTWSHLHLGRHETLPRSCMPALESKHVTLTCAVAGLPTTILLRILDTKLVDVFCVMWLGRADSQSALRGQTNP
jgi:hypothetical protein